MANNPTGASGPPTTLVTGLSGNVGRRLARLLGDRPLVAVDLFPPLEAYPQLTFCQLDISQPDATTKLLGLMAVHNVRSVIHLAFVLDPWRTQALTLERKREINIQGTQHLLDAVEAINRERTQVEHFLYLSSVTSYGPNLPGPVKENFPQNPHTYTYALHKKETDELCQRRHPNLRGCAVTIVRGHIFLGKGVENFISLALRGEANPHRALGRWIRRRGWKLPLLLPTGKQNTGLYQFMHIEDAARVLARLCDLYQPGEMSILNLQGRGPAVTAADCAKLGGLSMLRLPTYGLVALLYRLFWALGISSVPSEALPYFAGSYVMDTAKLETLLGTDYDRLVRFTSEESIQETVADTAQSSEES
jgi:nucleoside-diphosphate-sugar epimerase